MRNHPWIAAGLLLAACGTDAGGSTPRDDAGGAGGQRDGGGGEGGAGHRLACEDELASFAACGGDPVGTWEADAACLEGDLAGELREILARVPACADVPIETALDLGGSLTFTPDQLYVGKVDLDLVMTVALHDRCLLALSDGGTRPAAICADLDGRPAGELEVSCAHGETGCRCTFSDTRSELVGGSYEVRGDSLALTTRDTVERDFCVRDDRMYLVDEIPSGVEGRLMMVYRRGP